MEAAASAQLELKEHREKIAGMETFWREAPSKVGVPTLYVHGVPTNADEWTPFLEQTGGVALDLIGFGRSAKPMHFDGSIGAYNAFLQAFIAQQGWEKFNLVVEDWGGLAAYTAVYAPAGLQQHIEHVWWKDGRVIGRVPLSPVLGGRKEGFRTYSRKTDLKPPYQGRYHVDVVTAAGQLVGRLRFTVTP